MSKVGPIWFLGGCSFFAYSWKLPAKISAFLLTVGAFLLTFLASLLTVAALLLTVGNCV